MNVQTKELSRGSQLIMGLNPPFGVRGVKGDQFLDKIPEFVQNSLSLPFSANGEVIGKMICSVT